MANKLEQKDEEQILRAILDPDSSARIIALLNAIVSSIDFQISYQAWMATLPGYDSTVDDLAVVRDHDGIFRCKVVTVQQ